MLINSTVVFYGLLNVVRIVFNWCICCLRLINLYLIDLDSLNIMIIELDWCSWPLVRALWGWIELFSIELRWWGCGGGKLSYLLYFDVIYTSICCYWYVPLMVAVLCFSCNLFGPCRQLLELFWWFIYLIMWSWIISIYMISYVN